MSPKTDNFQDLESLSDSRLSETPVWDDIRLKSAAISGMPVNRVRNGSFRQASKFPLVAENCRWQVLHLKTRRHGYSIGSVRGSGVVIRIIGAIHDLRSPIAACL